MKIATHPPGSGCVDCGTAFPVAERKPDVIKYTMQSNAIEPLDAANSPAARGRRLRRDLQAPPKRGKTPTPWVKYLTDFEGYSEQVCFEHEGYALDKARDGGCNMRACIPCPTLVRMQHISRLPKPSRMKVTQDGKYRRVLDYDFKRHQPEITQVSDEERSYAL
jgi:DNA repair protein RadD